MMLPLQAGVAGAQDNGRPSPHGSTGHGHPDSVTVTPGPGYAPRSDLHLIFLGRGYRDLWTTPIRAPVLDLATFAGGLVPVRRGGSVHTRALRFRGGDGHEYNFRSIDKEFSPSMPEFARETFVDWIRQDITSASIPTAPVIAAALLDSVGVLNPGPRVYVLPDDPALGEFRTEFAGMLGTLEVHPEAGGDGAPPFAGATHVVDTEDLLRHLQEDLNHRVDARAFLKARLLDVLMGDFDRHGGQWRWAGYDRDGLIWWVPIPEDRDYAFVDNRGLFFSIARTAGVDRLVTFDERYPPMLSMLDNSLPLTRRLLAELSWSDWQAAVGELMSELTDARIRAAVMTLPPAHYALRGEQLIRTLLARRDRLPEAARELYAVLSEVVEVHGTDRADLVRVERRTGGEVEVQLFAREEPAAPRFLRVVDPMVTREIRVYLHGGDDEALVIGRGPELTVRLIGGDGDDRFFDRSSGPTSFHDFEGENEFVRGRNTYVDRRPWVEPGQGERDELEDGAARVAVAGSRPVMSRHGAADAAQDSGVAVDSERSGVTWQPGEKGGAVTNSEVVVSTPNRGASAQPGHADVAARRSADPRAPLPPFDAGPPSRSFDSGIPLASSDAGTPVRPGHPTGAAHAPPSARQQDDAPGLDELLPSLQIDWGESFSWFSPTVDWRSHARLVIGGGPQFTRYGFRQRTYQSRLWLRGLLAPLRGRFGAEAGWELHRSNSTRYLEVLGSVSGLEATVFHGFGNDTPAGPSDDFRIWQRTADLAALAHFRERDESGLHFGARLEYIDPQADPDRRPDIPADELTGVTRAGAEFGGYIDTRDDRVFPRSGLRLEAAGAAYPGGIAGGGAFLRTESEIAAYAPLPLGVLAVRAGGGAVFGEHPFYDAVFLGGTGTLRGFHHQRFAGDRAAFAGAELRVPLTRAELLVRGTLGLSLFADTGRVWADGDSPGGWHSGVGTDIWFYLPLGAVTLGYARGEEGRWFARLGMTF